MKIAAPVSRIVLGLLFTVAGISGFVLIGHPPPTPPGLAGEFQDVFFASRWVLFAFHATMQPAGLPIAAVVVVLWVLVAARHRDGLAPLLART